MFKSLTNYHGVFQEPQVHVPWCQKSFHLMWGKSSRKILLASENILSSEIEDIIKFAQRFNIEFGINYRTTYKSKSSFSS